MWVNGPSAYFLLQDCMSTRHSRSFDWLSHMIALFDVQCLLNFLALCFRIFISLSHYHLSFIMKFINLYKCLGSVNIYSIIFLYNPYIKSSLKMCYCCTVKSYILELYLQFRVRELFSWFWQGSWFRMSDGKL